MLGARLAIRRAGGPTIWRRVQVDGSYASSGDARVLAGLGGSESLDRIEVFWPDGRVSAWTEVPVGRYVALLRPGPRKGS